MEEFKIKDKYNVYDLQKLTALLRSENGCPWDREQTHESIRRNFIEETYEVIEAINEKDTAHLLEELGDVLTQVVFHASIEEDAGRFDLDDVADGVCKKLVMRHPHVFAGTTVNNSDDVLVKWDEIKRVEKKQASVTDSIKSVSKTLPGLWRAEKIQKKAAKVGFDWDDISGALDKLEEEIRELREAISSGENVSGELGDVLFSAVNVSRFAKVDPEDAINDTCNKFIDRFEFLEETAQKRGLNLSDMTLEEMDAIYNEGKALEK